MLKTAVTVLQEMMIKNNKVPEYECIAQSGPQHQATFEYRCVAEGMVATGQARSKKEAKQEAAKNMLQKLHARGAAVPPPFAAPPAARAPSPPSPPSPAAAPALEAGSSRAGAALDTRSYVALLRELCEEYRLGEPQYELVGDTGPPHLRHFTVLVSLGQHERSATSTTKKAARQQAAEQLYSYLRENLARLTRDFVEEEALQRAQEKSRARARTDAALARSAEYTAPAEDAAAGRPDLGQRVARYHLGLRDQLGDETCERGLRAMQLDSGSKSGPDPGEELQRVVDALGLRVEHVWLDRVPVVRVVPSAPPLAFAGTSRPDAARAALRYLQNALPATDDRPAARTLPAAQLA